MSTLTGLGLVEETILSTLCDLASGDGAYSRSSDVLAEIERRIDLGPRYAYEALCDLARRSVMVMPLLDARGNLGSPDVPPADPPYTECRVSKVGGLAMDAEQGTIPAVPLRLINGTFYRGGNQPAFAPRKLLAAVARLIDDSGVPDEEVLVLVGPPVFATGCRVEGEIDRLVSGHPASLHLVARIAVEQNERGVVLEISNLPPRVSLSSIESDLTSRLNADGARRRYAATSPPALGLKGVENRSGVDGPRLRCVVKPDADPAEVEALVRNVDGVTTAVQAQLPGPLTGMLRAWVREHAGDDTLLTLTRVKDAAR